jgi:hypothetical protein
LVSLHGHRLGSGTPQVQEVQGFWAPKEWVLALHQRREGGVPALFTDLEREMIGYAVEELDGEFKIHPVYARFKERIKWRALLDTAAAWERQGWLTSPQHQAESRRVTETLLTEAGMGPPQGQEPATRNRGNT